jgi:hypothetical protein
MYKIPVFYLKWYFGPSILKQLTVKEVSAGDVNDPLKTVQVVEYDRQKYQLTEEYSYPFMGQ